MAGSDLIAEPQQSHVAGPLLRVTVATVAAGSRHTTCLSAVGELYTWGTGYNGRLGHSIDDATRADSFLRHLVGQMVFGPVSAHADAGPGCGEGRSGPTWPVHCVWEP
jgi:hypothetical protein